MLIGITGKGDKIMRKLVKSVDDVLALCTDGKYEIVKALVWDKHCIEEADIELVRTVNNAIIADQEDWRVLYYSHSGQRIVLSGHTRPDEHDGELCRVRLCNEDPDTMCLVNSTAPPELVVIHRPGRFRSSRFVVDVDLARKSPTIIDAYWGDCWIPVDVNHPIGCSPGDVIPAKDAMRLGWVSATVALREW